MSPDLASLVSDTFDLWVTAIERKSGTGRGGKKVSHYGIARLRALIWELAVRGRLVSQDERDEPAAEMLARTLVGRSRAGGRRSADLKPTEFTPGLPSGWLMTPLSQVLVGHAGGGTPSKTEPKFWNGDIPWASVKDVGKKKYLETTQDSITQAGLESSSSNIIPAGNLILVTRMGLGQLSINNIDVAINQDLRALFLSDCVDVHYCYIFFLVHELEGSGMTVKGVKLPDLLRTSFPLPPLAEQHRIVAKVDELMALCDALESQSASALEAHQTLVETLLATLVNATDLADLAHQWGRLEINFDTLFATKASVEALRRTVLELGVAGKLVENCGVWPLRALGDYVVEASAGWSPKCTETPRSGEKWGVLKVSAVTWGRYQPKENKELPSSLSPRPEIEVRPGDFLISRANTAELVARSVVVPAGAPDRLMMSDKIIRFRFNHEIDPAYVNLVHASPYARKYYARVAGGTSSSMKNVSQSQIRALQIPIPPLAEQHRTVAKVNELMALCDDLTARLNEAGQTQKHLADSIVERAAA